MDFLWGLLVGGVVGVLAMGLLAGGSLNEKVQQAYLDGYSVGRSTIR